MSLPPITIPDLLSAGVVDPVNDLMLIRQGLTDRKVPVQEISQVRFEAYAPLPSSLQASDFFLVARPISGGGYTNYRVRSQDVTFPNGTSMWFNSATPPLGWVIDTNFSDCLLAVRSTTNNPVDAPNYFQAGTNVPQGTWQQRDVGGVTGTGLTIQQMPNHSHWGIMGNNQSNSQATYIHGARTRNGGTDKAFSELAVAGVFGGAGDNANHVNPGACLPHSHGNNWRPLAAVGCIGIKTF